MKKIAVEQAVGMVLCHDITGIWDGFKGVVFRRGHIITEADIPQLLDLGKKRIFIREERDEGLLHEDDCARRLSAMAPVSSNASLAVIIMTGMLSLASRRGKFFVRRTEKTGGHMIGRNHSFCCFFDTISKFASSVLGANWCRKHTSR